MDLDGYLRTLRADGSLDSAGTFTLNQAQALQKLKHHQIANPAEFSAGLVASAIACQADWVSLQTPVGGFHLEHNGASIPHAHLLCLFSSLLVSGSDQELAPVQELAYGLNALLSLSPRQVRVTCSSPDELAVLELNPQQLVVRKSKPFETYGQLRRTRVEVEGLWNGVSLLRRSLGQRPELDVLRQRCGFAGTPILVDERALDCLVELPEAVCTARLGSPPRMPGEWPAELISVEGDVSAWVGLCPGNPAAMTIVVHGISFPVAEDSLPTGLQAVLWAPHLRKDLSRAAIVQDEAYTDAVRQVVETCHVLIDRLSTDWRSIPRGERALTAQVLEVEARRCRKQWQTERADLLVATARNLRSGS